MLAVYFLDAHQHRWIRLGPLGGLQPSEIAKPALVVFLAFFIALRSRAINNKHTLMPAAMAVGLVAVGVVVADLGTAVVLMLTAATIFYVAGLEFRYFAIAGLIAMCGVAYTVYQKPYRLRRVVEYVDPNYRIINKFDKSGVDSRASGEDVHHQGHQLPIGTGKNRRGRRGACWGRD